MNDTFYISGVRDGIYIINRNSTPFLSCCGSRSDAEHIVELLTKDTERVRDSHADADDQEALV